MQQLEERGAALARRPDVDEGETRGRRGDLIAMLLEVQKRDGWLSPEELRRIAAALNVPEARAWGVASFYGAFRFTPRGRNHVKVCLGTACHIKGGNVALQSWERTCGVKEGEVSADGRFSIERVACVGCCAMAPVAVVNDETRGRLTPMAVEGIVRGLQGHER